MSQTEILKGLEDWRVVDGRDREIQTTSQEARNALSELRTQKLDYAATLIVAAAIIVAAESSIHDWKIQVPTTILAVAAVSKTLCKWWQLDIAEQAVSE